MRGYTPYNEFKILVDSYMNPALKRAGLGLIQYADSNDKVLVIWSDKSFRMDITQAIEFLRGIQFGLIISGIILEKEAFLD